MTVQTARPLEGLEANPGVYDVRQTPSGVSFSVDTEALGAVISYLSRYEIVGLECMPPTLEQLFMSHYAERS